MKKTAHSRPTRLRRAISDTAVSSMKPASHMRPYRLTWTNTGREQHAITEQQREASSRCRKRHNDAVRNIPEAVGQVPRESPCRQPAIGRVYVRQKHSNEEATLEHKDAEHVSMEQQRRRGATTHRTTPKAAQRSHSAPQTAQSDNSWSYLGATKSQRTEQQRLERSAREQLTLVRTTDRSLTIETNTGRPQRSKRSRLADKQQARSQHDELWKPQPKSATVGTAPRRSLVRIREASAMCPEASRRSEPPPRRALHDTNLRTGRHAESARTARALEYLKLATG